MTLQKITEKKQVTPEHLILNGQLNIPKDGVIQLNKDREAVRSYFINDINLKVVHFITLEEKLNFLVREKYIKAEVIEQYDIKFIKKLFKMLYDHKFRFKTFMGAYKFYSQYAMKTRDGKNILEKYEDRIAFVALATAEGDEQFAFDLATEMINQRYQPATPTMLSSGRVSGGELVSCFLLSVSDTMRDIGRSLNSTLHLSKMGGGVSRL